MLLLSSFIAYTNSSISTTLFSLVLLWNSILPLLLFTDSSFIHLINRMDSLQMTQERPQSVYLLIPWHAVPGKSIPIGSFPPIPSHFRWQTQSINVVTFFPWAAPMISLSPVGFPGVFQIYPPGFCSLRMKRIQYQGFFFSGSLLFCHAVHTMICGGAHPASGAGEAPTAMCFLELSFTRRVRGANKWQKKVFKVVMIMRKKVSSWWLLLAWEAFIFLPIHLTTGLHSASSRYTQRQLSCCRCPASKWSSLLWKPAED